MKMNVENKLDKVVKILKEKGFVVYREGGKEPGVFYAKEGDSRIGFVYPNNGYIYDRIKMWSFSRVYKPHKKTGSSCLMCVSDKFTIENAIKSIEDRLWVNYIKDSNRKRPDKIHSYGIKLPTNRLGNEGYFNSIALSDLESQIREVLKRCLSYKIVEEVPVIKYQLETNCTFSYDKNGNIVPNPSKEWTGGDENGKWRDGTSRLDALNTQPFGFSVYAKPFLKRVIEYGNGETKVEYGRLNTEKGTYAHWLNCVTSISYNRHKQVMEVECNECTSKLFVDMIKSICNISEQVKSFVNPEQIKAIAESNEPILLLSNN